MKKQKRWPQGRAFERLRVVGSVTSFTGDGFHLTRSGNPVHDLQPLDTLGHLLVLREGAEDVVYAHSTDGEATGGVRAMAHLPALPTGIGEHQHRGDNLGPDVTFHARFGKPGLYKLWAEFHPGKDHVTADFVVAIR